MVSLKSGGGFRWYGGRDSCHESLFRSVGKVWERYPSLECRHLGSLVAEVVGWVGPTRGTTHLSLLFLNSSENPTTPLFLVRTPRKSP